jgi:nucleotide-binding universal stress UspA family protein
VQRVSFDATLEAASRSGGGVGSELALTLIASTPGFKRSSESRTFLVACDLNAYSINALQWTMRALVENGDEVVVLRVFPQNATPAASSSAMAPSNSNPGTNSIPDDEEASPLGASSITDTAKDEAHALIASVMEQNSQAVPQRDISVTVEFVVGKVFATIHAMIAVYRPDSLIVGTKGKSDSLFNAFMGSVSKWAVANATIPTIVVRTPDRIRKTKVKRAQRQSYKGLIGERISAAAAAEKKQQDKMELSSTGTNDSQHDQSDEQAIAQGDVEDGAETEPAPRK